MATNFRQPGRTVTLTAPVGGLKSGQAFLFGSIFGVAAFDAGAGQPVEVHTEGVFRLPKPTSAIVFTEGARAYWDVSAANLTTVASTNFPIGATVTAAGATDPTLDVRLDGVSVIAAA
jgi:predicted RecA/RadA family phage recombinase